MADTDKGERLTENTIRAIEGILTVSMIISGSLSTIISPYYTVSVMVILGIVLVIFILRIDKNAMEKYKAGLQNDLEVRKAELEKEKDIEIAKLKPSLTTAPLKPRSRERHENETVNLDGFEWTDCRFYGCTITTERGNFRQVACHFESCYFRPTSGALEVALLQDFFRATTGPPPQTSSEKPSKE